MSDEPKLHDIEWDMMNKRKFVSFSVVNALMLRSALYPLVLVRTRLQVQKQNTVYTGSLDAFRKIIRTEGFSGLYRGFWINSIQVFSGFTYIVFYEKTRHLITNYTNISDTKAKAFLSGGISSALNQTLVIPFDVISQHIMVALNNRRKQGQSEGSIGLSSAKAKTSAGGGGFKSTYFKSLSLNPEEVQRKGIAIAIIQQLFREGGLRSFYKGYLATLICFVPSTACWWMLYHNCNEFLFSSNLTQNVPYMFVNCLSGTISGATVSIMTNPLDLLRANIQVHRPSSYVSAVKYLWKEDKWRIFSKGLTVRLTHSSLSSALIVIGYETMKRFSVDEKYRDQVRW